MVLVILVEFQSEMNTFVSFQVALSSSIIFADLILFHLVNSANQATGTAYIVSKMATFRAMLATAKITGIPVGTADAGSVVTAALSVGSDYVMANVSFICF